MLPCGEETENLTVAPPTLLTRVGEPDFKNLNHFKISHHLLMG